MSAKITRHMGFNTIYVAATSQHVGKTTSTLGLAASFIKRGYNVGYCKPVGQQFLDIQNLRVDKDAILFADLIDFNLEPDVHSPVILGRGATTSYLEDPDQFPYRQRVLEAAQLLSDRNQLVIHEGTGHPGVGSVADLSNAEVARMIGAAVIMVVEGGVGNTIDRLNLCLSLFREKKVHVLGVIINKVREDKIDKVRHYVDIWLDKNELPLLGVVPYDKSLANPIMSTISGAIKGTIIYNEHRMDNRVEEIIAGSLVGLKELKTFKNLLLVVSVRMLDSALQKIASISSWMDAAESPLSGIVATGEGDISIETQSYVQRHQIPLVHTELDTYGAAIKINRIEVKINQNTPWKVSRAIELIDEHVDIEKIIELAKIEAPEKDT